MSIPTDQAVYRVRRIYRKDAVSKKYVCTFEMIDKNTQQVMAVRDLVGKAFFYAYDHGSPAKNMANEA